jgi:hypothetical protein
MPFAVFRQHQRKLLAVFAILAMIGFVLSDTLPRWMNSGGVNNRDLVVAELYGKKIHLSDLAKMNEKRQRANRFMFYAGLGNTTYFGGATRQELIDALILEHEADRLEIPDSAAFARDWIDRESNGLMTPQQFEVILSRYEQRVGGEQLLTEIASQVRIALARQEIAVPVVTPLDVFRNYRDQTERASFKVVPVNVEAFAGKVADPTDSELTAFYDQYKDILPDPSSPTPGFKVPRRVKAEYLSIDASALAKTIQAKMTEDELKTYYESRKTDFKMDTELPVDLFKDAPELTPQRYLPLSEVRDVLSEALARDKANEQIQETFEKVREQAVDKFSEEYDKVQEDIDDAKKDGLPTDGLVLPKPNDLAEVAKQVGLAYEATPLVDRTEAEAIGSVGLVALARSGSGLTADPRTFAIVLFDPKTQLYDGFELADTLGRSDTLGRKYLIRKTEDIAAHVAPLDEIRDEVVRAWKHEKARPLARKAADELAARVKQAGGQIKELSIDNKPVLSIDAATKMKRGTPFPSQVNGQFRLEFGPPSLTDLVEIQRASEALIDALFALKPGEVAVEADKPEENFYVLTLNKRDPVPFMSLMGPNGTLASYKSETQTETFRKAYGDGMTRLRSQAGYKPQDFPTEEQDREIERRG